MTNNEQVETMTREELIRYIKLLSSRLDLGRPVKGELSIAVDMLRADGEEIERLRKERDALREFARSIMEHWPESGVDGCDLQDIAVHHGLLMLTSVSEPCCDHCQCAEYHGEEDMKAGVICYRRSALLTGVEAGHVPDA